MFAIIQMPGREASINFLCDNDEDQMELICVSFLNQSVTLKKKLTRIKLPAEWTEEMRSLKSEEVTFGKANADLSEVWLRTDTRLRCFRQGAPKAVYRFYDQPRRYEIRQFADMQHCKPIYVVHDRRMRRDIVVAIDTEEPSEKILLQTSPAHIIQCCLSDNYLYVLDSNQDYHTLLLRCDESGWPAIVRNENRSLSHIASLKTVIENKVKYTPILMNDSTMTVKGYRFSL